MASLRKRRRRYFCRVVLWDGSRQREREIPLQTESKVEALERLAQVEKVESDLKQGLDYSFPWQNGEGVKKIVHLTARDAADEFFRERQVNGLANSTVRRNKNSINALTKIIGETFPVERLSTDEIERFKSHFRGEHTAQGVNINLRLIKTFLRWCEERGYLERAPKVQMLRVPYSPPSYLTDSDFGDILALKSLDSFFKQVFHFHRETALRLSEPYFGRLNGRWLIIPAEYTKQKREHELELTDELVSIWRLMVSRFEKWEQSGKKAENFWLRISKQFLWACREVGNDHHFHDLRHTAAVRLLLITNSIYRVKELMGHGSVTTTEKYARFSRRRLAADFPSLKEFYEDDSGYRKEHESSFMDTLSMDTVAKVR